MQQTRTRTRGRKRRTTGQKVALGIVLAIVVLLGAAVGFAAHYPQQTAHVIQSIMHVGSPSSAATDGEPIDAAPPLIDAIDKQVDEETMQLFLDTPTRQIAAYGKVKIYSPIAQRELTGVLFHQASYNTALVMTTELPDANPEKVSMDHPVRVNHEQTEGDWVDADALHLYRVQDATQMDTSIDVGAKVGTTVYAPVTGTVVLVQEYQLYGYVPDISIHIQPPGHPELDVVLLHQSDPEVKAGDKVVGGVTPISHIRDIAKDLTDVQLGFFTAPDDPGNHSHVQVNNADSPGYRSTTLKDAYKVKD